MPSATAKAGLISYSLISIVLFHPEIELRGGLEGGGLVVKRDAIFVFNRTRRTVLE